MNQTVECPKCNKCNDSARYFCSKCGALLDPSGLDTSLYEEVEMKMMRIIENLKLTPHSRVIWNDTVDMYTRKVEQYQAIMNIPEMKVVAGSVEEKMSDFLELCSRSDFEIAFVGTIKTGKSTLINALLGHNYASMAVTPETAALTKFRSNPQDYVRVAFYTKEEWKKLWASRTSGADAFMKEYAELNADFIKEQWIGHDPVYREVANSDIESELAKWSSSKHAEHYFVKEIEVGISSLPDNFPKQVVFVDTPGLLDPVAYRSEITKDYIRKANAVFICVDAQKVQKEEIETISSVFSFSSHNKNKVYLIATHWDKLNNPEEDWAEQKKWLVSRLVGKSFFDNEKMAEKNIIHSSAHIYNLCRDYDFISESEKKTLKQFALGMDIDVLDIKNNISNMKNITNIDTIRKIINDEIASNYQILLAGDIENKYLDIMYSLKRISKEGIQDSEIIINTTNVDIDEMKKRLEKQEHNCNEVKAARSQLLAILKKVQANTQERLDKILPQLEKISEGVKK